LFAGEGLVKQRTWGGKMGRDGVRALVICALLFALFFVLSIGFGLGPPESRHDPSSPLLYVRRFLMIIVAVASLRLHRKENRDALGLRISLTWLVISLLVGIAMGFNNPGGFDPTEPIALILALFHTFATELFFRGYLFKTLSASMKGALFPILISSLCYGLFYLTTGDIWPRPVLVKTLLVILFSAVGAVYAYCYKRSGSFLVPWTMHFFSVLKYRMLF
jgi:membrane protease YdiL (CAAX protease family)